MTSLGGGPLFSKRDHFFADLSKPNRMYPLNMSGVNHLIMNPKGIDKTDDIDRTMKLSHVEQMPTNDNNYYQDLIKRFKGVTNKKRKAGPFSP